MVAALPKDSEVSPPFADGKPRLHCKRCGTIMPADRFMGHRECPDYLAESVCDGNRKMFDQ